MRLATVFKTALVGTGLSLAALGGIALQGGVDEEALMIKHGNNDILARKNVELAKAYSAVVLLTGTTLIAAGLRRRKESASLKENRYGRG